MALVNCLKVKRPKSASSINHLTNIVIFFAIGYCKNSGNSVDQLIKLGKKYRINEKIIVMYIKFFRNL